MKLRQLCLVGAVMLVVLPQATAQQQPAGESEVLEQLRALHARLDAMEARHAREREEYERTIGELRAQLRTLRPQTPVTEPADQEEELDSLLQDLGAEGAPEGAAPGGLAGSVGRAIQMTVQQHHTTVLIIQIGGSPHQFYRSVLAIHGHFQQVGSRGAVTAANEHVPVVEDRL